MFPVMKYINQTSRCAVVYRNTEFESLGVYDHQHAYILHICSLPGIRQDELAKRILVNKSNVARQLALLEAEGLVRRETSSTNRKHILVYPTEKCLEIYPLIKEKLRVWNSELLEALTEEERIAFESAIMKIAQKAQSIVGGQL